MNFPWTILKTLFFFFGLDSSRHKDAGRARLIISWTLRLYWAFASAVFLFSLVYAGLAEISELYYVHVFDVFLVLVLRLLLQARFADAAADVEDLLWRTGYESTAAVGRRGLAVLSLFAVTQAARIVANQVERVVARRVTYGGLLYLSRTLGGVVSKVKTQNHRLSPVVFVLVAYWTANIMYMVSRVVLRHAYHDRLTEAYSLASAGNFFLHFVALVVGAAGVRDEMLATRSVLLDQDRVREELFVGQHGPGLARFVLMLDDAAGQVPVTALGLFDISRNTILVHLGIIITYEFLIFQALTTGTEPCESP